MIAHLKGRDPFNQNSNRSDREKRTTSKGGPVFSKLSRLDRTDPLSFGPKFPESLVEWIAPWIAPKVIQLKVWNSALVPVSALSRGEVHVSSQGCRSMEVRVLFEVINRFIHYLRKFFNVCMIYRAVIGHLSLRKPLQHNIRPLSEELNVVFR